MKVPALSDWRLFMTKIHKTKSTLVMSVIIMLLLLLPQTAYAADGTDGTEMQVLQPQQLEIQLGSNWAGVEFQLKTDAGLYPGTISVGEDGVLRLEIGGSSTYTLTCLNSSAPVPDVAQAPAPGEADSKDITSSAPETESEGGAEQLSSSTEKSTNEDATNTIAGIPVLHIALFGGGLLIAVAALIGMRISSRRHAVDADYDEEEEFTRLKTKAGEETNRIFNPKIFSKIYTIGIDFLESLCYTVSVAGACAGFRYFRRAPGVRRIPRGIRNRYGVAH